MSSNPNRPLPPGVDPRVVQQMLGQLFQEGQVQPQQPPPQDPRAAAAPAPQGVAQQLPGMPPPPPHPSTVPPRGAPRPGEDGPHRLTDQQVAELQQIFQDPQAKAEAQKIMEAMGGDPKKDDPLASLDPNKVKMIAQSWNSRIRSLVREMSAQRGIHPGASKATDEALLVIWHTTPMGIEHEDVEDYANAVRAHLIAQGMTDPDEIEDQTMREVFPLRESLIKTGRPFWKDQVQFSTEMVKLTTRWLKKYDELPQPQWKVIAATKKGHGDPESLPRDNDSEAFPAGERNYR